MYIYIYIYIYIQIYTRVGLLVGRLLLLRGGEVGLEGLLRGMYIYIYIYIYICILGGARVQGAVSGVLIYDMLLNYHMSIL